MKNTYSIKSERHRFIEAQLLVDVLKRAQILRDRHLRGEEVGGFKTEIRELWIQSTLSVELKKHALTSTSLASSTVDRFVGVKGSPKTETLEKLLFGLVNHLETYLAGLDSENVRSGSGWVQFRTPSLQPLIAELSTQLRDLERILKGTNDPAETAALSDVELAQLRALLETALRLLDGPLIEVGLIETIRERLGGIVAKSFDKEAGTLLTTLSKKLLKNATLFLAKVTGNLA